MRSELLDAHPHDLDTVLIDLDALPAPVPPSGVTRRTVLRALLVAVSATPVVLAGTALAQRAVTDGRLPEPGPPVRGSFAGLLPAGDGCLFVAVDAEGAALGYAAGRDGSARWLGGSRTAGEITLRGADSGLVGECTTTGFVGLLSVSGSTCVARLPALRSGGLYVMAGVDVVAGVDPDDPPAWITLDDGTRHGPDLDVAPDDRSVRLDRLTVKWGRFSGEARHLARRATVRGGNRAMPLADRA